MDEQQQSQLWGPAYEEFMQNRHAELMQRISAAAQAATRSAHEVTLMAVSKTVDTLQVISAYKAGYTAFGENRPQELRRKKEELAHLVAQNEADPRLLDVPFDMIGNLQTNKVNLVLAHAHMIQSVSSVHLAEAISKRAEVLAGALDAKSNAVRVLLEVNVSGEESKSGFSARELLAAMDTLCALPALEICGIMTMAPAHAPQRARKTFSDARELLVTLRKMSGLELPVFSCGMSDDFEDAVQEGSTLVRLGRTVFDPQYHIE